MVVLAAVIAFCVAQDRGTSAGVGRYIAAQRAAPAEGRAGRGPTVTIDEVMGPANHAAVREGLRWSGRVAMVGLIGALVCQKGPPEGGHYEKPPDGGHDEVPSWMT